MLGYCHFEAKRKRTITVEMKKREAYSAAAAREGSSGRKQEMINRVLNHD